MDEDSCSSIPNCILSRADGVHMSPGLFWVMGLKVFLSGVLSLRAALGVFLTKARDGTPNDGGSSLTAGRNGKTQGNPFGVMVKNVLLSPFKYSTILWWMKLSLSSLPFVGWDNLSAS